MHTQRAFLSTLFTATFAAAAATVTANPAIAADAPQAAVEAAPAVAETTLTVDAAHPGAKFSPMFYGLMTEEINYSYDGGLYAELVRNRTFNDPSPDSHNGPSLAEWTLAPDSSASAKIALDYSEALNGLLTPVLKVTTSGPAAVANSGFFGVAVRPDTTYRASFWAKAGKGYTEPVTVALETPDGKTVFGSAKSARLTAAWKKYTVTFRTGRNFKASPDNRFVLHLNGGGGAGKPAAASVWFDLVSCFGPTFHNRPNGNRPDLMEKLAGMHPAFLRLPGGNYLEGESVAMRFDWKKTLGPLEDRPGHRGPWGYRSSDGLGLLEFLEWCEDLHMEPVLAVYAGYSLNHEYVEPGTDLAPYVQDALNEIEYVAGDPKTTKWGRRRAQDGHPAPFPLHYVEVGNEDQFDRANRTGSYDRRFAQFHDGLKARYPKLKLIATAKVSLRTPDVLDDHYYRKAGDMAADAGHYDNYDRSSPTKIFVGEWASQDIDRPWVDADKKGPTPTLNSALGDAAWLTGLERNADVVIMEAYAPLLVNVNPGGRQWAVNLIGYDGLSSYGSPSYWVQAMFGAHHGDIIVPAAFSRGAGAGAAEEKPHLFTSASRDSKTGALIVKVVNTSPDTSTVRVALPGVAKIGPHARQIVLKGDALTDTNSITDPAKIVPVESALEGISGGSFTHTFPAYSVTVLELPAAGR